MITLKSIHKCNFRSYDEIYFIARNFSPRLKERVSMSMKKAIHLPELSPSDELTNEQNNWLLTTEEIHEEFTSDYRQKFLAEIENNSEAKKTINNLIKLDKEGKNIVLLCYCVPEKMCHRYIIGEILQNNGANVLFESN